MRLKSYTTIFNAGDKVFFLMTSRYGHSQICTGYIKRHVSISFRFSDDGTSSIQQAAIEIVAKDGKFIGYFNNNEIFKTKSELVKFISCK